MGLDGFSEGSFTHDGATRTVYRRGSGPGVIVMHEVPGITPTVARFAGFVADAGFTAVMPSLFGTPGRPMSATYNMTSLARACISREFRLLAHQASSPITDWLRALCKKTHEELGGAGVGAIGMCLTGNFALALMVDDVVRAPVLSQPSLPLPVGKTRRAGLHVSEDTLAVVKKRCKLEGATVLGMRFTGDVLCPPERFERLRRELGDAFEGIEIDSSRGNVHGLPMTAHSVVTHHLVDEAGHPTRQALDRVLGFFRDRLLAESGQPIT